MGRSRHARNCLWWMLEPHFIPTWAMRTNNMRHKTKWVLSLFSHDLVLSNFPLQLSLIWRNDGGLHTLVNSWREMRNTAGLGEEEEARPRLGRGLSEPRLGERRRTWRRLGREGRQRKRRRSWRRDWSRWTGRWSSCFMWTSWLSACLWLSVQSSR